MYNAEALQLELRTLRGTNTLLGEERSLNQAILSALDQLVVVLDQTGCIIRFNPACEQLTGYRFDQVREQPFWNLFPVKERKSIKAVLRKLQQDQLPLTQKSDWLVKDGSCRCVTWVYRPHRNSSGSIQYVVAIGSDTAELQPTEMGDKLREDLERRVWDRTAELEQANQRLQIEIAERKKVENELRISEARFRMIYNQSLQSIEIFAPDGRWLQGNQAWTELYGVPKEEVETFNLLEDQQLVNKGIMPYVQKAFSGEATTVPPVLYDSSQNVKGGRQRWVQSVIYPVQDEAGNIQEVVLMHQDITDLKQAEEALRASEMRFRALFEQSLMSIQILSPTGWTLQVNEAWKQLFGATLADLSGYNMLQDQQLVNKGIMPYVQKGFEGEATAVPPIFYDSKQTFGGKGRESWTQSLLYPLKDEAGNIHEVVLMHQDITALKRAEQLARGQTEALTRMLNALTTNPELDQFLGQVLIAITEQLNIPSCNVWLYDAVEEALSLHMTCSQGQILTGQQQLKHPDVTKVDHDQHNLVWLTIFRDRRPTLHPDIANDPCFTSEERDCLLALGVKVLLCVPLILADEVIGALTIRNTERDRFTPEEIELAQALAHQATLAIQLTRLAEQSRQSAVLGERNRITREIHDTLAQAFTGILLQVGVAQRIAKEQPEEAWTLVKRVGELAREGLAEARRSVWALLPEALESRDLANALMRSVEQMTAGADPQTTARIVGTPRSLPPEVGMNLLRIGQEALTNALRHANAQKILVELAFEAHQIRLRVQDDGRGFNLHQQADRDGFGLISMRQRAEHIGGWLTFTSSLGQGAEVIVQVPLAEAAPREEPV